MSHKKKILICGGTGFIGTNLIRHFSGNEHYELHAVYNERRPFLADECNWHCCDLTNVISVRQLMSKVKPYYVVQAAATTSGMNDIVHTPAYHVTDNAVMNSYLFRLAVEHDVRHLIFFSCTVMYKSSISPTSEEDLDENVPIHEKYFGAGHTKLYLEKMCEFYSRLGKTKFTAIRHSNIYGPYDKFDEKKSHFFGASLAKVMRSDDAVSVWGTGQEKRDLLHVDDLVSMVVAVMKNQSMSYRLYNCGLGKAYSVQEVVKLLIEISGKKLALSFDDAKPTIDFNLVLNCDRADKELSWRPKIDLEDGIARTLDWYSQNCSPR